tara:strand:- start:16231 stop:18000 length:1770 start_codon:yes stop_codon:yes gene_type:complete
MKKQNNIFNLLDYFSPRDKQRIYFLQLSIVLVSFAEVFSVVLISSLSTLLLKNTETINFLNISLKEIKPELGILIFIFSIFVSSSLSIWLTYKINKDAYTLGFNFSSTLLSKYLGYKYSYYLINNSNDFVNKIVSEANRLTSGILLPYLFISSKIILLAISLLTLFLLNFSLTFILSLILFLGYSIYYFSTRPILNKNSIDLSWSNNNRLRILIEAFSSIRDVILSHNQKYIIQKFKEVSKKGISAQSSNNTIAMIPRYLMELLAYLSIFIILIFIIYTKNYSETELIQTISLFIFIALKVLPSMQQIFNSLATIKGNKSVLPILLNDLEDNINTEIKKTQSKKIIFSKNSELIANNISYTYPNTSGKALKNINLKIPMNQISCFVGLSGSGKSTMADILGGLLIPESGEIIFNEIPIKENILNWRKEIAYVSQEIKLLNASLYENIAFGSKGKINKKNIKNAIQIAGLKEFVANMDNGLNTLINESGSNLSGGQKQRVGIARALYRNAKILIMDESTNSLDNLTEKSVLESIFKLKKYLTIILITHKISTIKNIDNIFFFEKGNLKGKGNYDELYLSSNAFRSIADKE